MAVLGFHTKCLDFYVQYHNCRTGPKFQLQRGSTNKKWNSAVRKQMSCPMTQFCSKIECIILTKATLYSSTNSAKYVSHFCVILRTIKVTNFLCDNTTPWQRYQSYFRKPGGKPKTWPLWSLHFKTNTLWCCRTEWAFSHSFSDKVDCVPRAWPCPCVCALQPATQLSVTPWVWRVTLRLHLLRLRLAGWTGTERDACLRYLPRLRALALHFSHCAQNTHKLSFRNYLIYCNSSRSTHKSNTHIWFLIKWKTNGERKWKTP